jgi:hypothetical protein
MSKNGPDTIGEINLRNWEQTPDRVKRLITNLMEQLGRRVAALEEQCAALKAENQILKEQVKLYSKNSSKPPAQEIVMRTAALWRNKSFGSQSQAGSFFVSIMLTLVTSLRSQNCSVLDYLFDACHGARNGHLPLTC